MKLILPAILIAVVCGAWMLKGTSSLKGPELKAWVENPENGLVQTVEKGDYVYTLQYEPAGYRAMKQARSTSLSADDLQGYTSAHTEIEYFTMRISRKDGGEVLKKDFLPASTADGIQRYFAFEAQKDVVLPSTGSLRKAPFEKLRAEQGGAGGASTLPSTSSGSAGSTSTLPSTGSGSTSTGSLRNAQGGAGSAGGSGSGNPVEYLFEGQYGMRPYVTMILGFRSEELRVMNDEWVIEFRDAYLCADTVRFTFLQEDIQSVPSLETISEIQSN